MNEDNNEPLIDEYGNIHYLSSEISRGGQGVVYRTKDEDLAIKLTLGDADKSQERDNSLQNAFRRIRTLPLPHGIHISMPLAILRDKPGYVMRLLKEMKPFSFFSIDGITRASMDNQEMPQWLSGLSDQKFAQELAYHAQTGSTRKRLYALYKCASILACLHNVGVVYGDVSNNNAFIGDQLPCDCWIIDADNLRYELSQGGNTVYTPKLGAPEIVQQKDASRPRTDCWAFAVMAFQILALCHPFIGKKVLEPEEDSGWDAEPVADGMPSDLDEQAYAGFLPFIDDEDDDNNQWKGGLPRAIVLTPQLKLLFQETLGAGRLAPHRRPSMAYWALELARAFDNSIVCPSCSMTYYKTEDTEKCPYCQTPMPSFVIAKTRRWQMIFNEGSTRPLSIQLPHRLFHPFSLANSDVSEYEAIVDFKNHTAEPARGTRQFPEELSFEFISSGKEEQK